MFGTIKHRQSGKPEITADQFFAATGQRPGGDDLSRCNCDHAGTFGHTLCGWDDERNLPRFMTGRPIR